MLTKTISLAYKATFSFGCGLLYTTVSVNRWQFSVVRLRFWFAEDCCHLFFCSRFRGKYHKWNTWDFGPFRIGQSHHNHAD